MFANRPGYKRFVLLATWCLAAVVAGLALGDLVGKRRAAAIHEQQEEIYVANQRRQLLDNIRGIRLGEAFPSLVLWSVDGTRSAEVRNLLPNGGLVLVVSPGCSDCLHPIWALRQAR